LIGWFVAFTIPLPSWETPFVLVVTLVDNDDDAAAYDAVTIDIESILFWWPNILDLFVLDITYAWLPLNVVKEVLSLVSNTFAVKYCIGIWNGDDDGVKEINLAGADKRFVQSGWHVPYKCQITGWTLLATGNKDNAPYTFTGSLLTGDPISASIALHSDNSNDVGQILNLTEMHQSASLPTSLNDRYGIRYIDAQGAMSYSLEAGQHVYPRIKHTTLDGAATPKAQIQGNWTIYYRRIE